MSLINQMLRDLEQRNPADPANSPAEQPLDIRPTQPQARNGYRHALWLAVFLLTGIIWWYWRPQASEPSESAASTAPTKPQPTVPAAEPAPLPATPPSVAPNAAASEAEIKPAPAATTGALPAARPAPEAPLQPVPTQAAKPNQTRTAMPAKLGHSQPEKPLQRAETLFRQAENSASRLMQQEYLREVLQLEPRHLAARQKLLNLLVREGSSPALQQFLDESLALFPDKLIFITALAHYQVQQKDFAAAVDTLERINQYSVNDTQYLGLLAAAYQQTQRCAQALPLYQKLSQLQPEKAEHWLGLGICAEKQQQPGGATQAYQQALAKNSLSPRVVDYIKQRLNALTR